MAFKWLTLSSQGFDFEGVDGEIHTTYGCSLVGRFEFQDRLAELRRLLLEQTEEVSIESLYAINRRFRFLCDRCLRLNQISPEWVNLAMMVELLFYVETEVGYREGYLIELNEPKQASKAGEPVEPATLENLIAALSLQFGSVQEALNLARTEPADLVLEIAKQRRDLSMPPEARAKEKFNSWATEQRAKLRGRKQPSEAERVRDGSQ